METESPIKSFVSTFQTEWKVILIITAFSVILLYFYYTAKFNIFKNKGIPYMEPLMFVGNLGPRIRGKISFHDYQLEIYNYFKGERYGGYFKGRTPVLFIFDPNLIKAIMISDFDHFVDRNFNLTGPKYLTNLLLVLKGPRWRGVRSILTPVFSPARLKQMVPLLELSSQQMINYLSNYVDNEVELKAAMGRYTLEVIGVCAFGIECGAMGDENSQFIKAAEKFDHMSPLTRVYVYFIMSFLLTANKYTTLKFLNYEPLSVLVKLLKTAKEERRMTKLTRSDFLQKLIDVADKEKSDPERKQKYLDDDTIDAQCLMFLMAGYETSSTLLSFAIHVLANNPDMQDTLRKHIKDLTEGKEITYELLNELTYLDGFLLETLRKYPTVARVDRVVTKPYNIPNSNINLKPGDIVSIPIYGIHMDPQYYPEPHEFRPERFMGDEKKNRPSHLFLAFGAGPRNCIGLGFGMLSAKVVMVSLMNNFRFTTCSKTEDPVTLDKRSILLKSKNGLWVKVEKMRENCT